MDEILLAGLWFFAGLAGVLYADLIFYQPPEIGLNHLPQLAVYTVLVVSCVTFYVCAGIYFSARSKQVAVAHSWSFGIVLLHTLGPFLCVIVFRVLLRGFEAGLTSFFFSFTPVGLLILHSHASKTEWGPGSPGWEDLVLVHSFALLMLATVFAHLANRRIHTYDS